MSSSTTEEVINEAKASRPPKKFINTNLISLKFLLFFFFGAMGCLFPFLPLHMLAIGLSTDEIRLISILSPCIAMLGPLIAGPLADHIGVSQTPSKESRKSQSTGRCLRLMIAVCCIFAALFYALLMIVPSVERIDLPEERRPAVKFTCDENGATVHQERCRESIGCHRWSDEDFVGTLKINSCRYVCNSNPENTKTYHRKYSKKHTPTSEVYKSPVLDQRSVIPLNRTNRYTQDMIADLPPHVCYSNLRSRDICHVFTDPKATETVRVSLMQAMNVENFDEWIRETEEPVWCSYPVQQFFKCRVPGTIASSAAFENKTCLVECAINDPYNDDDSILSESQCRQVVGNPELTFWMYLGIRCIADIFPTAALGLLDTATVIATRETSLGRGDVGRQLAFGSLGFAIFGPLSGYLTTLLGEKPSPAYYPPIILAAVLIIFAAVISLCAKGMPLGPPENSWHLSNGILALPMSSVRKYAGETCALFFMLIILGSFSSVLDSFLPLYLVRLSHEYWGTNINELTIGIIVTLGALPAALFFWKSENFVDYCGHSNLLITAFIFYIVRYTGLGLATDYIWPLISGGLTVFTLEIMWITTILYFRHLIPQQMSATGQSLPVIAHFCFGRAVGAVIGSNVDKVYKDTDIELSRFLYKCMAIAAAVIASLYFVIYHGVLKPRCTAHSVQNGQRQQATVVQTMNGNGNYTPLRVYHNDMGRKGQFRY